MAWSDLAKQVTDFAVAAGTPESESIEFKRIGGLQPGQASWKTVRAQRSSDPKTMGFVADKGRGAEVIVVSKTEVPEVAELIDKVRIGGTKTYVVGEILSQDAGGFELYLT